MQGTRAILDVLKSEGVELVFAYPGARVISLLDAFHDEKDIRLVMPRHEQGGAHAADGYARATGKVGVVITTSGPGATNLVTGIANAFLDSVPMVCITGQVSTNLIGNAAFQEVDMVAISKSISKHAFQITDPATLPTLLKEAFVTARSGRPGPVVVDIPSDVMNAEVPPFQTEDQAHEIFPEAQDPRLGTDADGIVRRVAELINTSTRPLLYAGGGVISGGAGDAFRHLAEKANLPVAATLMGLGAFPSEHPRNVGMVGMHGSYCANRAVMNCDLLIAVGTRFNDRVTGRLDSFAPNATIVHIDVDPDVIAKNVSVDVPLVGEARDIIERIIPHVKQKSHPEWLEQINAWRREIPLEELEPGLTPQFVVRELARLSRDRAPILVTDVGQHQMWAAQYWEHCDPRHFISSGGLGTMGFGLPAAMGAQLGCPDRLVLCVSGDGGIQMNIQELSTIQRLNLPVKVIILNNGYLGMVRQWQDIFWNKRYALTDMSDNPDFLNIARAYGIRSFGIDAADQVTTVFQDALAHPGPAVIDVRIEREVNVFPMVPAGEALDNMIVANPA